MSLTQTIYVAIKIETTDEREAWKILDRIMNQEAANAVIEFREAKPS